MTLELVYEIPNIKTSKSDFPTLAKEKIKGMARRT